MKKTEGTLVYLTFKVSKNNVILVFNLDAKWKVMVTLWESEPGVFLRKMQKRLNSHNFFVLPLIKKLKALYFKKLQKLWKIECHYFPI